MDRKKKHRCWQLGKHISFSKNHTGGESEKFKRGGKKDMENLKMETLKLKGWGRGVAGWEINLGKGRNSIVGCSCKYYSFWRRTTKTK